jgi:hypothetical protein
VDQILWPDGVPTNVLRGALGLTLRDLAGCDPKCRVSTDCVRSGGPVCAYQRIFAPRATGGPSGFADPPRPFVIRAGFAGERTEPGYSFSFDVHLFDRDPAVSIIISECLREAGRRGLGPERGRAVLEKVEMAAKDGSVVECDGTLPLPEAWELPWQPVPGAPARLRIRFITPLELKSEGLLLRAAPPFAVLVARIRDRLSSLSYRYGEPVEGFDFRGIVERAKPVALVESKTVFGHGTRFSSRTGQHQPLSGFQGYAIYEGDFAESLGLLRSAYWTGVGSQTVWGHGAVDVGG